MSGLVLSEASESRNKKSGKFRVDSQTLFVTYPKCPLEPQACLEHLEKVFVKPGIDSYIIAKEQHMDGTYHLHVYLRLKAKKNIKDARKCDWKVDGVNYHPNIQGARSPKAVLKYVTKDGNYITNVSKTTIEQALKDNIKVGDLYKEAREKTLSENVESGMKVLEHSKTYRDLVLHGEAIERNLKKLKKSKLESEYTLDSFNLSFNWDRSKTLILTGPTNTGKTSLAAALLPKALFVTHIDRLKDYADGDYDGIIFDDMSFKHFPREAQIHLVDTAFSRDIHCRYSTAMIPKKTPRIITSNLPPNQILLADDPAIARRLQIEIVENSLMKSGREDRELDDVLGQQVSAAVTTTTSTTTSSTWTRERMLEEYRKSGLDLFESQ